MKKIKNKFKLNLKKRKRGGCILLLYTQCSLDLKLSKNGFNGRGVGDVGILKLNSSKTSGIMATSFLNLVIYTGPCLSKSLRNSVCHFLVGLNFYVSLSCLVAVFSHFLINGKKKNIYLKCSFKMLKIRSKHRFLNYRK